MTSRFLPADMKPFPQATFLKKIEQTIDDHQMINRTDSVLAGVSGGPDSVALVLSLLSAQKKFNTRAVAQVVAKKQQLGTLDEGELFSFEVFFQPNQNNFSPDQYNDAFAKVVDLASTYGGAVITVEGHSDPMGYLRKEKKKGTDLVLTRTKMAAKNLSLTRAIAVRDSIMTYSAKKAVNLDASQFSVVGHGITAPRTGICGKLPCAPKTKEDWLSNMRVVFRIIQIEAEEDAFIPLD